MIVPVNAAREVSMFYPRPYQAFRPRVVVRRGLGQSVQPIQTGITLATIGAGAGASIAGAAGSTLIGSLTIGAAIPIFGTIAGLLAGVLMNSFHGCGQTCILASDAANKIESLLQQNLSAYLASPRTQADQAAALQNFDTTWAQLVQYCGQSQLGSAGQNCIGDRQAGSCKYHTSPGGWDGCTYNYPGLNNSGSTCWNWFVGYRDPIASDPCVKPNAVAASSPAAGTNPAGLNLPPSSAGGVVAGGNFNFQSLLLPAALILGGVMIMGSS